MLYSGDRELEDQVVELLVESRLTIKTVCAKLSAIHRVSLRGVYKAVNKLIEAGVVLKVGKRVMLSEEWTRLVSENLSSPAVPLIGEGERIAHTFTSLEHLDAFWKSTVLPLERVSEPKEVFIYNPHSFWALLPERKASEEVFFKHFGPQQQGFLTIGGECAADLALKRQHQTDYLQINLQNIGSLKRTDHVTVLGPYIILTRLSKAVVDRMDALYSTEKSPEELLPELLKLCNKPAKLRLIVENNPKKSEKLRRTLARDFYLKRPE